MRIFAMIPDAYFMEASDSKLEFKANCTLAKDDGGEMTLIITVTDVNGNLISGTQFIAELKEGK